MNVVNPFLVNVPPAPTSRLISEKEFASIYAATEFAAKFDLWFDTTVTLTWSLMGLTTTEQVTSNFVALTKCLRDWLRQRQLPVAFIFSHEQGQTRGLHTHLALYVPGRVNGRSVGLRREFRQWIRDWVKRQIGQAIPKAVRVSGSPEEKPWVHWLTMSYLLKGYDKSLIVQSAQKAPDGRAVYLGDLIASAWEDPGPVAMKARVGCSMSLGPGRRAVGVPGGGYDYDAYIVAKGGSTEISSFISKYDEGVRDARRLYPPEFYLKVTREPVQFSGEERRLADEEKQLAEREAHLATLTR